MKSNVFEDDIIILIKLVNKELKADFDQRLNEYGLTSQQGRLLFFINGKVNFDNDEVHQNDIEKKFHLSKSTVSGLVTRLIKTGYIEKEIKPPYCNLKPTEKGEAIVDEIIKKRKCTLNKLLKGFNKEEKDYVMTILKKLLFNMKGENENVAKD